LLIREEKLGLLESLVLKVLEKWSRHSITYDEVTQAINRQNATNMCYMNAQKERGSDSENSSERITEFGVVVAKIW
jgi:hypothetical protein